MLSTQHLSGHLVRWCLVMGLASGLYGCVTTQDPGQLWPTESPTVDAKPQDARPLTTESSVTDELLAEAETLQDQQQWQQVINVAEQGLRIDRREPKWYMYLAQSYLSLQEYSQAQRFAEQGLRYSAANSTLKQSLQTLLSQARERMLN